MLALPFGPSRQREGEPNGLRLQLELEDGTPAEPPTFDTAVPTWRAGDTIPLGRQTLRVVEVKPGPEPDADPVLVVKPDWNVSLGVWLAARLRGGGVAPATAVPPPSLEDFVDGEEQVAR